MMRVPFRSVRTSVWALLLCCLVSVSASAVPSKYVKQKLVASADKILKAADATLARFDKLKADGKLDNRLGDDHFGLAIARDLRQRYADGLDAYAEAMKEGWPADDAEIVAARAALTAVRTRFEAAGMWVAVQFGEKPIGTYQNKLEVLRDEAFIAVSLIQGQKVDEGKERLAGLDQRLAGLRQELQTADDEGRDLGLSLTHPAYKRTLAEIERIRQGGQGGLDATNKARELIDRDIRALLDIAGKCRETFRAADGLAGASGTEEQRAEQYTKALAALDAYDKNLRPEAERIAKEFGAKYGTTAAAIIPKLTDGLGGRPDYNPSPEYSYDELVTGIASIGKARAAAAERLLGEVKSVLDKIDGYDEFTRLGRFDLQKPKLELALKFDPGSDAAKQRLAGLAAEQQAASARLEKEIDARTWGGNVATFAGPGTVGALAKESLAYVRANGTKEGWETLALRVVGDWFVFEKDALGRPLAYGLPVEVAQIRAEDKAAGKDVAAVFELSMVTRDTKMAPPFKITAVGGSWWVRAAKVARMP